MIPPNNSMALWRMLREMLLNGSSGGSAFSSVQNLTPGPITEASFGAWARVSGGNFNLPASLATEANIGKVIQFYNTDFSAANFIAETGLALTGKGIILDPAEEAKLVITGVGTADLLGTRANF